MVAIYFGQLNMGLADEVVEIVPRASLAVAAALLIYIFYFIHILYTRYKY
jgi:hypothetical protein